MPILSSCRFNARGAPKRRQPSRRRGRRKKRVELTVRPLGPKVRHYQLYGLNFKDGAYYVGMTAYRDVMRRFEQHVEGKRGAKWTRLYKPVDIIETRRLGRCTEAEAAGLEIGLRIRRPVRRPGPVVSHPGHCCKSRHIFAR